MRASLQRPFHRQIYFIYRSLYRHTSFRHCWTAEQRSTSSMTPLFSNYPSKPTHAFQLRSAWRTANYLPVPRDKQPYRTPLRVSNIEIPSSSRQSVPIPLSWECRGLNESIRPSTGVRRPSAPPTRRHRPRRWPLRPLPRLENPSLNQNLFHSCSRDRNLCEISCSPDRNLPQI